MANITREEDQLNCDVLYSLPCPFLLIKHIRALSCYWQRRADPSVLALLKPQFRNIQPTIFVPLSVYKETCQVYIQ